jgi:hypothetical protein
MCLLIVLRGVAPGHPVVVASNRDERFDRKAAPPGLWVGQRRRVIAPRDREAGGTWLGVNDRGLCAGLTNIAGAPQRSGAATRGMLPHLALDQDDLEAAVGAVRAAVLANALNPFQLVLCDGRRTLVLRYRDAMLGVESWAPPVLVVSNEHEPGQLELPGLSAALPPALELGDRLDRLATLLLDPGGAGRHAILKKGDGRGTVSSALLAVAESGPNALVFRYAAGPPDVTAYRDYGNLGRRLTADEPPLATDPPARGDQAAR